jgi:hypothetical protein
MKSGMPVGKSQLDPLRKRFDPLRERMDIFISGRAPSDPLYLTNRTWRQKLKIASLIVATVLLLTILLTIVATNPFGFHRVVAEERPPADAPLAAAPQRPSSGPLTASTELEVVDVRISRDARPPVVTGTVRNRTGQKIDSAEVSYYLADAAGSMVGTDTTEVVNLEPYGSVAFRAPLKVARAVYVIVRDAHPK